MSFLVRAAFVIGALSYFAANRDEPPGELRSIGAVSIASLPTLWQALPPEVRERALHEAAVEAGHQLAGSPQTPSSADTLAEADRRLPWRGSDPHRHTP